MSTPSTRVHTFIPLTLSTQVEAMDRERDGMRKALALHGLLKTLVNRKMDHIVELINPQNIGMVSSLESQRTPEIQTPQTPNPTASWRQPTTLHATTQAPRHDAPTARSLSPALPHVHAWMCCAMALCPLAACGPLQSSPAACCCAAQTAVDPDFEDSISRLTSATKV